MTVARVAPLTLFSLLCAVHAGAQRVDWPTTSGDAGAMRYSALADVNRENVSRLKVAWRWNTGERSIPASPGQMPARPGLFQASPVVIGDTLYVSTGYAAVAALHATTGVQLWKFDPEIWRAGQPSNGTGLVHRGVGHREANDAFSSMRAGS